MASNFGFDEKGQFYIKLNQNTPSCFQEFKYGNKDNFCSSSQCKGMGKPNLNQRNYSRNTCQQRSHAPDSDDHRTYGHLPQLSQTKISRSQPFPEIDPYARDDKVENDLMSFEQDDFYNHQIDLMSFEDIQAPNISSGDVTNLDKTETTDIFLQTCLDDAKRTWFGVTKSFPQLSKKPSQPSYDFDLMTFEDLPPQSFPQNFPQYPNSPRPACTSKKPAHVYIQMEFFEAHDVYPQKPLQILPQNPATLLQNCERDTDVGVISGERIFITREISSIPDDLLENDQSHANEKDDHEAEGDVQTVGVTTLPHFLDLHPPASEEFSGEPAHTDKGMPSFDAVSAEDENFCEDEIIAVSSSALNIKSFCDENDFKHFNKINYSNESDLSMKGVNKSGNPVANYESAISCQREIHALISDLSICSIANKLKFYSCLIIWNEFTIDIVFLKNQRTQPRFKMKLRNLLILQHQSLAAMLHPNNF